MKINAENFGKGGCGCALGFVIVALIFMFFRGSKDIGGTVTLLLILGVIGFIIWSAYKRSKDDP